MNNEPLMFTCDWCGKEFPADPATMTESGFCALSGDNTDPADAWKGEPTNELVTVKIEDVSPETIERMKSQMGLTDAQCKELLETGHVENGASCVCMECQDASLEE